MKQVFNPYLPLNEYVPDGEPHLFEGRVYIYGSHDKANGKEYCEGDYVVYSAPEDDLKEWRCEGVSYRRNQDPSNAEGKMCLWAPDVTRGPDGRYYLYYCFSFYPEIGVAVSETPAGPFSFYGHVHYPAHISGGKVLEEFMPFDPAVLTDEDGRVYLYYGFAPAGEKEMHFPEIKPEDLGKMPSEQREIWMRLSKIQFGKGAMVAELEPDMLTLKAVPQMCVPGGHLAQGTGFEGHAFFEASSIRKINQNYYFVYSSHKSHELCYATSQSPTEGFVYGGTLIANGDVGLEGREIPCYTLGNNHGGLVGAKGQWYVFYHRPTNGTEFSRQGCAEPVEIKENGHIAQVEMTSCGLNGGPLQGKGAYPAAIACHMTSIGTENKIDYNNPIMHKMTRITEAASTGEVYLTDVQNATVVGFKYFAFEHVTEVGLEIRGHFQGKIYVAADEKGANLLGEKVVELDTDEWMTVSVPAGLSGKKCSLYILFSGKGNLDFKSILF